MSCFGYLEKGEKSLQVTKIQDISLEDLQSGMIVEFRDESRALVMKDNCYGEDALIYSSTSWSSLRDWKGFRKYHHKISDRDIVKVIKPGLPTSMVAHLQNFQSTNNFPEVVIWKEPVMISITKVEYVADVVVDFIKAGKDVVTKTVKRRAPISTSQLKQNDIVKFNGALGVVNREEEVIIFADDVRMKLDIFDGMIFAGMKLELQ